MRLICVHSIDVLLNKVEFCAMFTYSEPYWYRYTAQVPILLAVCICSSGIYTLLIRWSHIGAKNTHHDARTYKRPHWTDCKSFESRIMHQNCNWNVKIIRLPVLAMEVQVIYWSPHFSRLACLHSFAAAIL